MTEGPLAALAKDWRAGLAAGRARALGYPRDGGLWLGAFALACLATGSGLFACCGYHGGFLAANATAHQLPDGLWQTLTVLGDERLAFALSLFIARRHPQIFWSLIVAALLASAYTHGLKPLFEAARPPAVLAADDFHLIGRRLRHNAFPSGHSVTAAVLYGTLVYYIRSWRWRLVLLVIALAAGLSRIAVGVHWPVDVAAGLSGGALAAWIGARLSRTRTLNWGVQDVSIHLAMVTLAGIMAVALLLWDGGYPAAAWLQYLIGLTSLGYALAAYLLWPLARWGRRALGRDGGYAGKTGTGPQTDSMVVLGRVVPR